MTSNLINYIGTNLDPLIEYAEEPLLPLYKACAPLENIIDDLSLYIKLILDETPEQPSDGLTIDESAAIRLYTFEWNVSYRSLYSMINRALKNNDHEALRPYFKYLKLFLTALVKLPCVPPMTVWRGVTRNLTVEFSVGTQVIWWAFLSCTTEMTVLENELYLGNSGNRTTEDEVLLLPGTHMIVQSQLSPAPDLYIIHLKQVRPEKVLLEPLFSGMSKNICYLF
ncbi:unnamed protein product [Adineta steineri]|uniref:Mono(ADP-ribosyl)transferase n=1 Tax=Adineta steineri TaxID=433720 RepID=A0A814J996_9BILA|nr:unnamed protein product [Adineta steineri]CAF1269867.1 unnamed protein product [Adineta steineri]